MCLAVQDDHHSTGDSAQIQFFPVNMYMKVYIYYGPLWKLFNLVLLEDGIKVKGDFMDKVAAGEIEQIKKFKFSAVLSPLGGYVFFLIFLSLSQVS